MRYKAYDVEWPNGPKWEWNSDILYELAHTVDIGSMKFSEKITIYRLILTPENAARLENILQRRTVAYTLLGEVEPVPEPPPLMYPNRDAAYSHLEFKYGDRWSGQWTWEEEADYTYAYYKDYPKKAGEPPQPLYEAAFRWMNRNISAVDGRRPEADMLAYYNRVRARYGLFPVDAQRNEIYTLIPPAE